MTNDCNSNMLWIYSNTWHYAVKSMNALFSSVLSQVFFCFAVILNQFECWYNSRQTRCNARRVTVIPTPSSWHWFVSTFWSARLQSLLYWWKSNYCTVLSNPKHSSGTKSPLQTKWVNVCVQDCARAWKYSSFMIKMFNL